MTPKRIAEIRAACKAATPGPWEVSPYWMEDSGLSDVIASHRKPTNGVASDCFNWDAAFIALARTAVPELLAEVERLEGILVAVRAEMEQLRAEAQTEMPEEVSIEVLQPREQPCQGCGITNKPLNRRFLCSGCLAIIGLTAENARLRADLKWALDWLENYWCDDDPEWERFRLLKQVSAGVWDEQCEN